MAHFLNSPSIFLLLSLSLFGRVMARDTLFSGDTLNGGQFLENGPYKFIMQTDCNVVLYLNQNTVLWNTRTNGKGSGCRLALQSDGNLVNYAGTRVVWASGTNRGLGNYRLVMQGDGNVVLYFNNVAIWATNTQRSNLAYKY